MQANSQTLKADIEQLELALRFATRLVRGIRYVPHEERLRQFNLLSLERGRLPIDLILVFKFTARTKPSSTKEWSGFCACREKLQQAIGVSIHVNPVSTFKEQFNCQRFDMCP